MRLAPGLTVAAHETVELGSGRKDTAAASDGDTLAARVGPQMRLYQQRQKPEPTNIVRARFAVANHRRQNVQSSDSQFATRV
jgi:hypothetical protein